MEKTQLNTAPKWKKICCIVVLICYCTAILIVVGIRSLGEMFNLIEILTLILMIPQLGSEMKKLRPKALVWILIGFAAVFLFEQIMWDNILLPDICSRLGIVQENANTEKMTALIRQNPVVLGLAGAVFGPVLEELLYRYTFFALLYDKNKFAAHTLTALIFGLQHIFEAGIWGGDFTQLINIPGYMIFSLVMTCTYVKTKNLWIPIGIHVLSNGIGVIFMLTGAAA